MSAIPLADTSAALPAAANPLQSPDFLVAAGLLASALLVGAGAVWGADRWRRRQANSPGEAVEAFASIRALFDRGEISREEYERIRSRMAADMKQEAAGTPAAGRTLVTGGPPATPADPASGGRDSPGAGRPAAGPPPPDPA